MSHSLTHRLRAQSWQVNKRTYVPLDEVPDAIKLARRAHHDGRYEEAIALVEGEVGKPSGEAALTVKGLALFGLGEFEAADRQFQSARDLARQAERESGSEAEKSYFQHRLSVGFANEATSKISQKNYEQAWPLAKEALGADDQWHLPYVVMLSVERRREHWDAIKNILGDMSSRWPQWQQDEHFQERLYNDTDLAGVSRMLNGAQGELQ
ncbi:MAG: hypothetical protein DRR42_06155 [Gammaproteobacteria bacterium]|nr:MAG: hypothetical protein DRR42_06155 [Gammaproteobacteria bacterium]